VDKPLKELRVVVTGAARGLGRTVVEGFLAAGARVHIGDVDASALEAARTALPDLGTTVCDVADQDQVDQLFDEVRAGLGGLDVLINNAGIAGPTAPMEAIEVADWMRTLAVDLTGSFLCARRAVPLLKEAGGGSLINVSSAGGRFGYPLRSPYAAAKWGLIGFTQTLAMELGPFGVRVNALCPGFVASERLDRVIAAKAVAQAVTPEAIREGFLRLNSMHTFLPAAAIANAILFLCSPAGAFISGQILGVDGNLETLRV
jgi:NAD(P)-dependent dehydrogenase (short-subunit alcohol dehydrogenase family)